MKANLVGEYSKRVGIIERQLGCALIAYADSEDHLKEMCRGIWPDCGFYRGGTHLRVMIEGNSDGKSFYVNLV